MTFLNKGRIEKAEGGFAKVSRDGKRAFVLPAETGYYSLTDQDAQLTIEHTPSEEDVAQPSDAFLLNRREDEDVQSS